MTQPPASKPPKSRAGCALFVILASFGFIAIATLGGAAYYFGFFDSMGIQLPAADTTLVAAASSPTSEAQASILGPSSTPEPLPTVTQATSLPVFKPYQLERSVQYLTLFDLSKSSGVALILPNQPAILEFRWCADSEVKVKEINSSLDITVTINEIELPLSSFDSSIVQDVIENYPGNKVNAFCNSLSAVSREWAAGDYLVEIKLRAVKPYDDGWKTHPQDELIESYFRVKVDPSAPPIEWGRCALFEDLSMDVVYPEWKSKAPLEYYFKINGGVPGLEKEIPGDTQPWAYTSKIEDLQSNECGFQGYDERLYCKIDKAPSGFSNTTRPLSLSVNGCGFPIYYNPLEVMPKMK